jgi:hypothetical protein
MFKIEKNQKRLIDRVQAAKINAEELKRMQGFFLKMHENLKRDVREVTAAAANTTTDSH